MNTPALNGNEGVVQDKREHNNESLIRRGKQQHPSKKVKINIHIFAYLYIFKLIKINRNKIKK
jgi:hypothetical protein